MQGVSADRGGADVVACLVFTAASDDLPVNTWAPGPLPLELPDLVGNVNAGTARRATAETRRTHIAARVAPAVHGSGRRWHRWQADELDGARLLAWEMLRAPHSGTTLLVAHVSLAGAEPMRLLADLSSRRGESRAWLLSTLPEAAGGHVRPDRPHVVTHVLFDAQPAPEPYDDEAVLAHLAAWTPERRWEWFAGTGMHPGTLLPDPQNPTIDDGVVPLSRDWRAHVFRAGVAYVARTPTAEQPFHAMARALVRSIHLDVVLLGLMQREALRSLADAVGSVPVDELDAERAEELEAATMRFRTELWWSAVGNEGEQVSRVLMAQQQAHSLDALHEQIVRDLTDVARFVQVREARRHADAERVLADRQRVDADRRRAVERTVALVTFFLLPLTVVYSGAAVLVGVFDGWIALAVSTALGLGLGGLLFAVALHRRR